MAKIKKRQILEMKNAGLTNKTIAKRLGISTKTVQRTCSDLHIKTRGRSDKESEQFQRDLLLKLGTPGSKVAAKFGVSRQAVCK